MEKFYFHSSGAKIFLNTNLHEVLEIPNIGAIYEVLAVGLVTEKEVPIIIINEENKAITFRLPKELECWAFEIVSQSQKIGSPFPRNCVFMWHNEELEVDFL